jgi:hypothetical protein
MPWQELGGANTGLANNGINPTIHWLGTRDNDPLIIRTENGPLGAGNTPNPAAEVMRITPASGLGPGVQARSVGIGTPAPRRKLHVEGQIHTGGLTRASPLATVKRRSSWRLQQKVSAGSGMPLGGRRVSGRGWTKF